MHDAGQARASEPHAPGSALARIRQTRDWGVGLDPGPGGQRVRIEHPAAEGLAHAVGPGPPAAARDEGAGPFQGVLRWLAEPAFEHGQAVLTCAAEGTASVTYLLTDSTWPDSTRRSTAPASSIGSVPGAVVPLATVRYGTVPGLPAQRPDVLLVVSRAVAAEVARPDLVFPDLEIRDEHHRVIGCHRLARFAVG